MLNKHKDIIVSLNGVTKKYTTVNRNIYVALKNINLEIRRGERIGIIGNNGAGKTTLLKIIGGITKPSNGKVITNGRIVSLIDLEAGFEPELTGFENITVNGLLVGMKKQNIRSSLQSIIRFADIGAHINEPFYTYSAGMKFRLACAVAINCKADVLLFDEILNSGDWNFQKKLVCWLSKTLQNSDLSTIICSYVPETLWALAHTYYMMHNGVLTKIGRDHVRSLAISHHNQFHSIFRTNKFKEVSID